jgi:hypothetical protein
MRIPLRLGVRSRGNFGEVIIAFGHRFRLNHRPKPGALRSRWQLVEGRLDFRSADELFDEVLRAFHLLCRHRVAGRDR